MFGRSVNRSATGSPLHPTREESFVISRRAVSHLGHRVLKIAVVAALAATGVAAISPAAQAATSSTASQPAMSAGHAGTRETFTIPAGATAFSASAGGEHVTVIRSAKESPMTTTCTLNANTPYAYYGSTGDGELGSLSLTCTQVVYELVAEAVLFLNGTEVSYNINSEFDTSSIGVNVTYELSPGDYETGAVADVYWTTGTSYSAIGPVYSSTVYLY
jgi:hypothetical protein